MEKLQQPSLILCFIFIYLELILCILTRIPTELTSFFTGSSDYNTTIITWVSVDPSTFMVYHHVLSSVPVWLFTVLLLVVAIAPDVFIRVLRKHWISIRTGAKVSYHILRLISFLIRYFFLDECLFFYWCFVLYYVQF